VVGTHAVVVVVLAGGGTGFDDGRVVAVVEVAEEVGVDDVGSAATSPTFHVKTTGPELTAVPLVVVAVTSKVSS
jgi:hypothetical protein